MQVEKKKELNVRYGKCSVCQTKTEIGKLYNVTHITGFKSVRMCAACGARKIKEWNDAVRNAI